MTYLLIFLAFCIPVIGLFAFYAGSRFGRIAEREEQRLLAIANFTHYSDRIRIIGSPGFWRTQLWDLTQGDRHEESQGLPSCTEDDREAGSE